MQAASRIRGRRSGAPPCSACPRPCRRAGCAGAWRRFSRSSSAWKVSISPNTEAVSASVSGVSDISAPCGPASTWCTPWPSSCASVITSRVLAVIVQQQIGMRARRHGRMGEGARRLARPRRRVDPALVEELLGRSSRARARRRHRHRARSSGPSVQGIVRSRILRQRRVAVPIIELVAGRTISP